jgi:SAM-dependent methyltransferase
MSSYDLLAKHYDAVTGDSSTEAAFIDSVIRQADKSAVTLLEVACGTGSIIALLADRYRVSGLDISPGLLSVAREKLAVGTELYLADMSSFRIDAKFDAVICVFHGINHLLSLSAWKDFFSCAYTHLNDGGVLVFDTMTIGYLKMMASLPKIVQDLGDNHLVIRVKAGWGAVFEWNIELFELQQSGRYELQTEVIRTAAYPPEIVREALGEKFINILTIVSEDGVAREDGDKRTWFVCTRPSHLPSS